MIMLVSRIQLGNVVLCDDSTPYGGTAYANETADEFTDTVFINEDEDWTKFDCISLDKLNGALKDYGIKPIKKYQVAIAR